MDFVIIPSQNEVNGILDSSEEEAHLDEAFYITAVCKDERLLMTLINNGSSMNVGPLRTALRMGLIQNDPTLSSQGIRAYDKTRRLARYGLTSLKA